MTGEPLIRNVADTARWVAYYRAMETERKDAHFRDPYARRLAGERGQAIVAGMKHGRRMAWPMIVRTTVMDEIITRSINAEGVTCVLNLAAGLDARPWRMAVPADLAWFDVDQAEMVDLKTSELAGEKPRCKYEAITADLKDASVRQSVLARVGGLGRKTLVITEGLLVYLPEAAVEELARDLHAQPSFALWLTDLASPALLKWMAKDWGKTTSAGGAPFIFGPADAPGWFAGRGWRERKYRNSFQESIRLKRSMRFWWLWAALGKLQPKARQEEFKRFSGISLLERA